MSVFDTPRPSLPADDLARLAERCFGVRVNGQKPLVSERDQNVLLDTGAGRFVLKIANAGEDLEHLALQNAVLGHLAAVAPDLQVPRLRMSLAGAPIVSHQAGATRHAVRLVSYLDGTPLSDLPATRRPHRALGTFLGRLSHSLAGFGHRAAHRSDFPWNLDNVAVCRAHLDEIVDAKRRAMVARLFDRYETEVAARVPALRASVIHGDANDNNVIVNSVNGAEIGLIDFGDMTFGRQVNEPAIAIAYALLEADDLLAVARTLVAGYAAEFPLAAAELDCLFDLVRMRLVQSVCISCRRARLYPDNPYLLISQEPAFAALERLEEINPAFARCALREAAGLPAVAEGKAVLGWLASPACRPRSLFAFDANRMPRLCLSLAPDAPGPELKGDPAAWWRWLERRLEAAGAAYAIGLYGEHRTVYRSDAFASAATTERRTQHLGLDFFLAAGSEVRAPLPGTVLSAVDSADPDDYGPTVILEHRAGPRGPAFWTLYGHLSRETVAGLRPGREIAAGEAFATLGDDTVNGGWAPHLHFQIITDRLGLSGNFHGVGEPGLWPVWRQICPDPNLICRLAPESFAPADPPDRLLARRSRLLGPSLTTAYSRKLAIVRGQGAWLMDHRGRACLDCVNNIAHVGHCHPHVVEAMARQSTLLNTNTRYLHRTILDLADRLTATLPAALTRVFFVNSGSEAGELALRLARTHTGARDVVVLDWAYHGNTTAMVEISPYKFKRAGGFSKPPFVEIAELPDPYRGPHRGPGAGPAYAASVAERVAAVRRRTGRGPAAFIAESISGVGGQVIYPDGYLADAYASVRAAGGLCIADEVQCGLGRVGDHFWAFEDQGVTPDIVVIGKPFGNGHPLAAVVTTDRVATDFANGMEYFNSFGGNPVSMAVGMAVLDVIETERLQPAAAATGQHLLARLAEMKSRHTLIGDVRGRGLFAGVELVEDHASQAPATTAAKAIVENMRDAGILVSTDGPLDNVVKIKPPMVFGEAEADILCDGLEAALVQIY